MAKTKIMVVEDEGIVALDIQSKLEGKGYEVPAVVATGEEAVQKAEETRPNLVLMDIQLEGEMDGVEAADQIRTRFSIPVVYLTAYSDENTLQRAKISEPFGYLLKPFEEKKLHTTIEIALYKHQIEEEKARLEAQLHQAQKMEAIGRLTAGITFNFTNMLQGIQGNLDLAQIEAPDHIKPYLDAADFDAQRASQLLRQLMLFYQNEQSERQAVDLGRMAREVVDTCRQVFARKYPRRIDFSLQIPDDLLSVEADPAQLRQCLTALCANAGDAIDRLSPDDERKPRIVLGAANANFEEEKRLPAGLSIRGQYVQIRISDNGVGMDAQTREHLFEPFLSTQDPNRATGLGLAMVYAILREHRGGIHFTSEPDSGTAFILYLPAAGAVSAPPSSALTPEVVVSEESIFDAEALRGDEKILVIADVDRYRKILSEMLERHGYEVLVGLDVRDGLNIFQFEKDSVALVVLDLSTPSTSGLEILDQLCAIDPQVRVLVSTGFTTDSTSWQGARIVLNKPFKTHQLLRTVRRVLVD